MSMAATLGLGDPLLDNAIKAPRLAAFPITRHRNSLQSEVNPDCLTRCRRLFDTDFHRQTQPPVPDGILRKAALLPLHPVKPLTLEHSKRLTAEAQRLTLALEARRLERHPAKRTACTPAHPPAELAASGRSTLRGILPVHALDRISADLFEVLRPAGGEIVQLKSREPLRPTREGLRRLGADFIRPVPHGVDFARRSIQPGTRPGLHLQPQSARNRHDVPGIVRGRNSHVA